MKVNIFLFEIPQNIIFYITQLLLLLSASNGEVSAFSTQNDHYRDNWDIVTNSTIRCLKELIHAEVSLTTPDKDVLLPPHNLNLTKIYWQNIHMPIPIRIDDPLKRCQPLFLSTGFMFKIPLSDLYKCGFTQVVNKLSGDMLFQQNLILDKNDLKHTLPVKCLYTRYRKLHNIVKRGILPDDFKEDEDLEIIDTLQQTAPIPLLSMEVRQNGQLIDRMVNVIPGTPLIMEIKLNDESSKVYGIHVQYLEVSDGNSTSETILFRGCTVDPYLFENFILTPQNTLQGKFRAFKFPNTPYVQFRANVRICLGKCLIPHCLSGQGRSRRELKNANAHIYEVSLGVVMKIDENFIGNKDELRTLENHVKKLKKKNESLRNK
ncbi:uncharacterized protein [Musca autumnalis]|uniref:uncharacterized protein n=1 Tax=Musca autumnalis TaxID=221902 RepID=UPI003CE68626